jgi:hypothetical protein
MTDDSGNNAGLWFSPVSSTNKTDRHDITEILLKVTLYTIILTQNMEKKIFRGILGFSCTKLNISCGNHNFFSYRKQGFSWQEPGISYVNRSFRANNFRIVDIVSPPINH